MKPVWNWKL